jgi:hypothetical protein
MSEVMFVSSNSAVEIFTIGKTAEMKRLRPPVLVEIGCKVIIPIFPKSVRGKY